MASFLEHRYWAREGIQVLLTLLSPGPSHYSYSQMEWSFSLFQAQKECPSRG